MIGERLTSLRKERKWTQEEIAKKVNIPRSTYSNYENGKREPDFETAKIFAELFEVSIDYLLGRTADPKRILKEQARQLIDMIDLNLTDEEIMSKMNLYVDGLAVEEREVKIFIDLVRGGRIRMKQGLASTENKQ